MRCVLVELPARVNMVTLSLLARRVHLVDGTNKNAGFIKWDVGATHRAIPVQARSLELWTKLTCAVINLIRRCCAVKLFSSALSR